MSPSDDTWNDELVTWHGLPVGRRVLVADDDATMREALALALRERGYQVATVRCWPEPTSLQSGPASTRFDLIVADLRLPASSALDVIDQLRQHGDTTPVIITAAFPQAEARTRAKHLEVRLLEKPFGMETLRSAVDWAIRTKARREMCNLAP